MKLSPILMPYFNHFFSKWKYSQGAIDERNLTCTIMPENCKNENWFMNEFNAQFQEKFGLNKTFLYAFMDSWSQSPLGINDPVQQEYWQQETQKLWEFSTERNETFEFMTIDDVLEENAACKEENERLLDIINEEIAKLQDDVRENKAAIATTNSRVGEAEMRIGENQDAVEDNTAALDLLSNEGTFSTYILKLKDKESRSHNVCPRFKLMQNAKLIKPFF